ncbi:thermonuclease family protein [Nocardia sp. NPDC058640]|uniref:thermonuclease family protein n=1 Tax=Nocardia sp. NPDC058640 TaxID=3346571 RepID=UPI003657E5A9
MRRIVDGDTLTVAAVAPGTVLDSTSTVTVRLLEVDTPETKDPNEPVQCFGPESTAELARLAPVGSTVWVQRDQDPLDGSGRHLLYLWTASGEFVNLALVRSGYAEAVLYPPNDKHWAVISAAEAGAKSSSAGVWGACPGFGEPPPTPTPVPVPPNMPEPDQSRVPEPAPVPPPTRLPTPTKALPDQSGLPPQRMGPDTDCADYPGPVSVAPGDPHRLDADDDGVGCDAN